MRHISIRKRVMIVGAVLIILNALIAFCGMMIFGPHPVLRVVIFVLGTVIGACMLFASVSRAALDCARARRLAKQGAIVLAIGTVCELGMFILVPVMVITVCMWQVVTILLQ